ncbi:RDD domain-containing protein [Raphidiopsis curvata NIES-932]|nr:RDD domain-containing protein [Raphidiopsis curvata NIES-932]
MHLFNKVKFNTPESVELEFTLAGIGSRAWAFLIDYLVLTTTLILVVIAWIFIFSQLVISAILDSAFGLWIWAIAFLTIFTIYTGYFVFFETLWQGQTPGKRMAKIRVIRDDGRLVGLQQSVLRALLRPMDEFFFIGAFLIILAKNEKRLGDMVAGTIVIQSQTENKVVNLTISPEAQLLCVKLQQTCDLSQLLPDDFAVIREYLKTRGGMSSKAKASLSLELSQQVQSIVNLSVLPSDVSADVFLEAVYLGYQKLEFV